MSTPHNVVNKASIETNGNKDDTDMETKVNGKIQKYSLKSNV